MKKVISIVLAACIMLSVNITAFAAPKSSVEEKIESAASFLLLRYDETGFTAASARTFEQVVKSGADVSDFENGFISSAAEALSSTEVTFDTKVQVIAACVALGEFPASFTEEQAEAMLTLHPAISSPYNYVQALELCSYFDLDASAEYYADALCEYYVMGTGAVFWDDPEWMSCDDCAMFVIALAPYAEDYADYIEDALDIIADYRSDEGYTSFSAANTDTTALALAAYSVTGYRVKADEAYDMLLNFYNSEDGGFEASYDRLYATMDALIGLEAYSALLESSEDGWHKEDGNWYYYKDGELQTGWVKDGGKWYYLDDEGVMQTGWVKDGGKWYYMNSHGAMQTGWVKVSGKWYFLNKSGAMQTGWVKDGGKWYYMNKYGAMQTGWVKVSGKWYYMNKSGAMQTGWVKLSGKWYYLNSNGSMRTADLTYKGKVYRFYSNGACINP